jgi:hypothetical protein
LRYPDWFLLLAEKDNLPDPPVFSFALRRNLPLYFYLSISTYNLSLYPMADVHSKEIRSKNMAAIKGKNTKPEMLVRGFLHANGFRYKLHDKALLAKDNKERDEKLII